MGGEGVEVVICYCVYRILDESLVVEGSTGVWLGHVGGEVAVPALVSAFGFARLGILPEGGILLGEVGLRLGEGLLVLHTAEHPAAEESHQLPHPRTHVAC